MMKPTRLLAFVSLFFSLACGPAMRYRPAQTIAFSTQERCSQGPFVYELDTLATEYEQELWLALSTPQAAQLRYEVTLDGLAFQNGVIGATTQAAGTDASGNTKYVPYTPSSSCVVPVSEGSPQPSGSQPVDPAVPVTPVGVVVPSQPETPEAAPPRTVQPPTTSKTYAKLYVDWNNRIKIPSGLAGRKLKVTLWSNIPYPFGEMQIEISLQEHHPKDPAKYAAWKKEKAEKEKQKQQKREEKYLAKQKAENTPKAQAKRDREMAKRQKKDEKRRQKEEQQLVAYLPKAKAEWQRCLANDKAWQQTGSSQDEQRAAYEARLQLFRDCTNNSTEFFYWKLSDPNHRKRFSTELYAEIETYFRALNDEYNKQFPAVAKAAQRREEPPGPPPLPWEEDKGTLPTEGATWRSGYWSWNGFHWVWQSGSWQLPPTPPSAVAAVPVPPTPQPETITVAPSTESVWISGYWQWNGKIFVWIPGKWILLIGGKPKK